MATPKNTTAPKKRGRPAGAQYQEIEIPKPDTVKPDELAKAIPIGRGRQSNKYNDAISRLMDGEQIAYRNVTETQRKTIMVGLRQQMKSKNKLPNVQLDLQFGWIEGTRTLVVWNNSEAEQGQEE